MKFGLTFEIECGKETCANKPGEFCRFFRNDLRGGGNCFFFGKLFEKEGWIQRAKECKLQAKEI